MERREKHADAQSSRGAAADRGLFAWVELAAGHRLLFIGGQVPERPDGSVPRDFDGQCRAAWANVLAVLASAKLGPEHLVKVTTWLADRSQAEANGRIRREHLSDHRPALTVVEAQTLESPWLLEIEAIAAEREGRS